MRNVLVALVAGVALTASAQAATIIKPTAASATWIIDGATTEWDSNHSGGMMVDLDGTGRYASRLVDGAGPLPASAPYPGANNTAAYVDLFTGDPVPASSTSVVAIPTGFDNQREQYSAWMSASGAVNQANPTAKAELVFNFGASYNVSSLLLWNYVESYNGTSASDRGIKTAQVLYSTDGTTYTPIDTFNFNQATANNNTVGYSPMQTATFASTVTAQYMKIIPLTNFATAAGQWSWDNGVVGVNEVRFTAVPEPVSLGLLGLGAMALIRRRRA